MYSTVRAVRGAIRSDANTREAIARATVDLVDGVLQKNDLRPEDIEALMFTMTSDLTADIPPLVLAEQGVLDVPCLCAAEPRWDGEMPRVIRVMAFVRKGPDQPLEHVYLSGAAPTRPSPDPRSGHRP
ncbi:chorismate mutase [Streptomyces sp. NPDC058676]|uniref:chorismate mutase n=1 Tax=unclassified Streptomyces TaxID=2593676 RepID=UPI0036679D29